ncbi:MAG: U32 family peptidase [Rhodobacteraceae bacterium]|nr:U32 family peptidase [Paracoccaceae bacterium]
MDLTVGANPFFWDLETIRGFYGNLAKAPVARVVIGELVCSKRLPFVANAFPEAVEMMTAEGKDVALTALALVTLKRERKQTADLFDAGITVEINDLSALQHLPDGQGFWVGPLVNVYNEGTLRWLAAKGAQRICLPLELPIDSVRRLAEVGRDCGVAIEVWGHGRAPLAISARCYHARLHDRIKDNCQFVCGDDPDGREVDTLDAQKFLVANGVQTLSHATISMARQSDLLREAGVSALRLSPQSRHFAEICEGYARVIMGREDKETFARGLVSLVPDGSLADGFLTGECGADWSGTA